jgi:ribosomal protein L40E
MTTQATPWICPKCKAENDPDFNHCRICATPSPLLIKEGEHICASCGKIHAQACCPGCNSPDFLQL